MPTKNSSLSPSQAYEIHLKQIIGAGLDDTSLATNLQESLKVKRQALVVVNGYTARVLTSSDSDTEWQDIGHGEFGEKCSNAVKPFLAKKSKKQIFWVHVSTSPITGQTLSSSQFVTAKTKTIKSWQQDVEKFTVGKGRQGRQAEASALTRQIVSAGAAWRCQFPGCGVDLQEHFSTGKRGNFSYFAHIVASSPNGPRGSDIHSIQLADEPENFLLLCDHCHRLIDRVSPDEYSIEKLRAIREASIAEVSRLLDTLRYREVKPYAILGNLGNQVAYLSNAEVREALWSSKLRCVKDAPETLFQPGSHLYKEQTATYWGALFETLRQETLQIQRYLNGLSRNGASRDELAIFPLHLTSILIVAGHIFGDNGGIHLFQPHRDKVGEDSVTRWAWPVSATPPLPGKYRVRTLESCLVESGEACLLVSLTFHIDPNRLPEHCYENGQWRLPALEVFVEEPNPNIISHPEDLQQFGKQLDSALRILQDQFQSKKIHLIVGAPTTAAFVIGQKMQARHHAPFICHESIGGPQASFLPSIEISSSHVRAIVLDETCPIQLQP